jgi:hypothetical protein
VENVEYSARERSIRAVKGAYSRSSWTRRREGKPVRSIAAQALSVPLLLPRPAHRIRNQNMRTDWRRRTEIR